MARRRKLSPERKEFINGLLEHYQPSDAHDVQEMLKDLLNFPVLKHRHSGEAETASPVNGNRESGDTETASRYLCFYRLRAAMLLVNL